MKRGAGLGLLVLVAVAAWALRGDDLARRPMHNDEAINAFKLQDLLEHGRYRYDPHEYHGPVLYYASLPVVALSGSILADQPDETRMRMVTVVFGVGLILVLGLVGDAWGWPATIGAALITAVSPVMVFYSRYYIHEVPLVFFTLVFLAAGWRYRQRPGYGWAMAAGSALGLMYATKETFVFALAAAFVGVVVAARFPGVGIRPIAGPSRDGRGANPGSRTPPGPGLWMGASRRIPWRHALAAAAAGALVAILMFSSWFTNARGPWDAIRAYFLWFEQAGGASRHAHPWYFYWQRLGWFHQRGGPVWTESLVLVLALVGAVRAWRGRGLSAEARELGRFLVIYSVVLAAEYSLIPYKTPWCLLGFYHGLLLLAGMGAWTVVWRPEVSRVRWLGAALIVLGLGHLAWEARRASHEYAADFRNPYVYGHTSPDIVNLLEQVTALSGVYPGGHQMPLQVIAPESGYWPLPWYWRKFENVGWWDHVPENPFSAVIVVASKLGAALEEKSNKAWLMVGMFELRPRFFVELYVERSLWERFLARRASEPVRG